MKDMTHPRLNINGKREKIPLCMPTGRLAKIRTKQMYGMDELGLGISIYFKLLKSITLLMVVLSLITFPVFYIYGAGQMKEASNTSWLSYLAIGNIGQTQQQCNQNNFEIYSDIYLQCPGGTNMTDITQFGLKDINGNSTCPIVNLNSTGINLQVEDGCNWNWERNPIGNARTGLPIKNDKFDTQDYRDRGKHFSDIFIESCMNNDSSAEFGNQNCRMGNLKAKEKWSTQCWDYIQSAGQN